MTLEALSARVRRYLSDTGMTPSAFGKAVYGDNRLVRRIAANAKIKPCTIDRIIAFMDRYPSGHRYQKPHAVWTKEDNDLIAKCLAENMRPKQIHELHFPNRTSNAVSIRCNLISVSGDKGSIAIRCQSDDLNDAIEALIAKRAVQARIPTDHVRAIIVGGQAKPTWRWDWRRTPIEVLRSQMFDTSSKELAA